MCGADRFYKLHGSRRQADIRPVRRMGAGYGRLQRRAAHDQKVTQPGAMGLLLDTEHPLFDSFSTDFYADCQWWSMSRLGWPMNLEALTDELGNRIQPLVKIC